MHPINVLYTNWDFNAESLVACANELVGSVVEGEGNGEDDYVLSSITSYQLLESNEGGYYLTVLYRVQPLYLMYEF